MKTVSFQFLSHPSTFCLILPLSVSSFHFLSHPSSFCLILPVSVSSFHFLSHPSTFCLTVEGSFSCDLKVSARNTANRLSRRPLRACSLMERKGPERTVQGNVWLPAAIEKRRKRTLIGGKNTQEASFSLPFSTLLLFSSSVMSSCLWPHGLQHSRLPCPSPSPGVCSNSCPLSRWCHPTISSSAIPFSSCPQSFPESGSFLLSLRIRWLKNWNFRFSISPSSEYSGLISFRIDSLGSLLSKGLKSLLQNYVMPSPRITSTFLFPFSGDLHVYLEPSRHRENGQAPPHSSHCHALHLPPLLSYTHKKLPSGYKRRHDCGPDEDCLRNEKTTIV